MSEQDTTTEPPVDDTHAEPPIEGEEHLGDPGKKALDSMKQRAKDAEAARREAEKQNQAQAEQIATLQAQVEALSRKGDVDVDSLIAEKVGEVQAKYLAHAARASIRAAATGVVIDPDLVVSLPEFDPTNFVTDAGDVDESAIAEAIRGLVSTKPYLAAQGQGVKGSGDGGPRNGTTPSQLTRSDLERMSPEEIDKARLEGRLQKLLSGA